jgi:hypothetical protein
MGEQLWVPITDKNFDFFGSKVKIYTGENTARLFIDGDFFSVYVVLPENIRLCERQDTQEERLQKEVNALNDEILRLEEEIKSFQREYQGVFFD